MRTISAKASALAGLALTLSLPTPALAQGCFIPDAEQIELLCPGIGIGEPSLGAIRSAEHQAVADALDKQAPYPLTEAALDYTVWSMRLASVTWRGAGFEGMEDFPWLSGISEALEQEGWTLIHAGERLFPTAEYRKTFATGDGAREFAVVLSSSGNFELTCGDAALMELSEAEAEGRLAEGSPRPVPPSANWQEQADTWLARFDCGDPALVAGFAGLTELGRTADVVTERIGHPPDLSAEADYQNQLATWLKWKIQVSGKVSVEQGRAIEDRASADPGAQAHDDLAALVIAVGSLAEAEEGGDGAARCTAARSLFTQMRKFGEHEAARTARANQVRMAEARKLGIAVD
ncbi:MAG: hypothetical protein B7X57_04605 [Erythrobacter sp. 34-65-8]|nr:MAG: hypothetical protein B7X57_04605 [Erythrobacter sp. 34-65-8]